MSQRDSRKRRHPEDFASSLINNGIDVSDSSLEPKFFEQIDATTSSAIEDHDNGVFGEFQFNRRKNDNQATVASVVRGIITGEFPIRSKNMVFILMTLFIFFISWIFVQDNSLGRVDSWLGIWNFLRKSLVPLVLSGVLIIAVLVIDKPKKKTNNSK